MKAPTVDTFLKEIRKGRTGRQGAAEIANGFINKAGGFYAVGELMWAEYKLAPAGSLVRQRILLGMIALMTKLDDGVTSAGDLSALSEEDLKKQAANLLGQVFDAKTPTHAS
jgi:hypothetical protein